MRRGLSILAGLVGLLALAAWLVPPALDASRYRALLEEVASEALGSPARIEGTLAFTLLPQPRLTATNVILGNDNGPILRAEELRLRVAPWPMLAGHFTAHDLVLRGADMRLPWPPRFGGPSFVPTQWATPFPTRVEKARLILGGVELRDIAADIRATENGFEMRGTTRAGAHDWNVTARLGAPDVAGATQFEISAEGTTRQSNARLRIDGHVTPRGEATARASFQANDLSQLLSAPAIAMRGSGQLRATAEGLRAEEWALSLPPGIARLDAVLGWQPTASLAVRLAMPRLDLDPWLPVLVGARSATLPVTLDIAVEAASLGGRNLREVRGRSGWGASGIHLREGQALLPGDAALSLDGTMPVQARAPWFTGHTRLSARDARLAVAWLDSLLGLKLPAFGDVAPFGLDLTAGVELGAGSLALSDMRGQVAGTEVRGGFGLRQDGSRGMILADLDLGEIRINPWTETAGDALAVLSRGLANGLSSLGGEVQARIAALRLGGGGAQDLILDAGMSDGRLTLRRLAGNAYGARFDLNGGLSADGRITDMHAEVSATDARPLRGLLPAGWQATPALWDGPINLRTDISGTPENLGARMQLDLGDLRIDTQQTINAVGGTGAYRLTAQHPGALRLFSALGITASTLPAGQAGPEPGWPGEGSFSLQAQGTWRDQALILDTYQLTAGALRGGGQLGFSIAGEQPAVTGQFHAESLPLPLPAPSANGDIPLPLQTIRTVKADLRLSADDVRDGDNILARQAACNLAIGNAQASLEACTMQIGGGVGKLDATLSAAADAPSLAMKFSLERARMATGSDAPPLPVSDGALSVHGSVQARGYSLAALRDTALGEAAFSLNDVALAGMDLGQINTALAGAAHRQTEATTSLLRTGLTSGTTPFETMTFSARVANGILTFRDGAARGPSGAIDFSGSVDLGGGMMDADVHIHPTEAPDAGLAVRLSGAARTPERVPVLLPALRWLAERTQ